VGRDWPSSRGSWQARIPRTRWMICSRMSPSSATQRADCASRTRNGYGTSCRTPSPPLGTPTVRPVHCRDVSSTLTFMAVAPALSTHPPRASILTPSLHAPGLTLLTRLGCRAGATADDSRNQHNESEAVEALRTCQGASVWFRGFNAAELSQLVRHQRPCPTNALTFNHPVTHAR